MREVVQDAFEEIGVKTAEVALTSDELQSGIRRCNDMLTEWAQAGSLAGYNPVFDGDDTIEADISAIGAIKYNLAVRLAPSYQKQVSMALATVADTTLSSLRAANTDLSNIPYPDSLPMGSGNTCKSYTNRNFYPTNKRINF